MVTCTFEKGNQAYLRHAVVDNIITDGNKILLVKRAAHLSNPGKYGVVGGFVDRNENLQQAVTREVLEETGYEIQNSHLFAIVDNPNRPKEDRQNIAFVYTARAGEKVGEPDNESSEVRWFELDDLPTRDEFAFDHFQILQLYLDHLKNPKKLPVIISSW